MRVVAGKAKGTNLESVPGDTTRPILDRVKTALFDVIRPRLANINMLDLFAGSGSVGIEALSQGANHCTFIDLSEQAIATITGNLKKTRLTDNATVRRSDAFAFIRKASRAFDLIYIAPPQYKSLWVEALHAIAERPELVTENGFIICQIDPREYEALALSDFKEVEQRKYGNTLLVFFERNN